MTTKLRNCQKKRTYDTQSMAALAVKKNWDNAKMAFGSYHCDICGKYHLSKIENIKYYEGKK